MLKLYLIVCILLTTVADVISNPPNFDIYNKFQQSDYNLKFERANVVSYDKHIANRLEMITFKYNRTCVAINATLEFNVDVGNEIEVVVQAYKFMSNEYRYFPLRFQVNFCFALSTNLGGLKKLYDCGNFTGCPLKKGIPVHISNWTPNESKLPPLIPSGRYMWEFQALYRNTEFSVMQAYAEIYRPIPIPD